MLSLALFAGAAHAADEPPPPFCSQKAALIDTFLYTDGKTTKYEISTDGYDPEPLLWGSFVTSGERTCAVAHLSFHTLTGWGYGDEFAAFKVSIDGQAMYGHTTACATAGVNVPCILADNNAGIAAHSYHLVLPNLPQGSHVIQVQFAGADANGAPSGAYAGGTILTVHHE